MTSMAKKENNDKILEYLKSHSQATEDEIAKDLNINVVEVLDSLITMEKEGLLQSIPVTNFSLFFLFLLLGTNMSYNKKPKPQTFPRRGDHQKVELRRKHSCGSKTATYNYYSGIQTGLPSTISR